MAATCRDHQTAIHIGDGGSTCKKCIFRVPKVLRRQNAKAYTPDVVSIGPFHFRAKQRKEDFQRMEGVKENYLNELLAAMKNITVDELITKVTLRSDQENEGSFEERARNLYAEPLDHVPPKDFIKMMIVDGCFLIQFFRKFNNCNLRAFDDPVFNMDCMCYFLFHDILLLENQLPWFVIHILYGLTLDIYHDKTSLSVLILKALSKLPSLKHSCTTYMDESFHSFLHILDLVRASIVFPSSETIDESNQTDYEASALQNRSATALSNADIKFKVNKDPETSIRDIKFTADGWLKNGTLLIPQLTVGMLSETLFRNLIAAEQCYHGYANMITSYAIFMDNLISSKEDLDLLCKKEVICNLLSEENGWLAALKFEKFSNPWRVLAFVIGIIVVVLTIWNMTNNTIVKLKN